MLQGEGSISNRMGEGRLNERDVAHSSTDCKESVIWKRLALNGWPIRQYYPNVRVSSIDLGDGVRGKTGAIVTMHIGELAENTGLSLRTIRHYDEVGLLKPSGRTEGGFRLYSQEDLSRLLLIRRMKPLGYSLGEMTELLSIIDTLDGDHTDTGNTDTGNTDADPSPVRAELDRFIDETATRREKLRAQVEMADEFLELLRSR